MKTATSHSFFKRIRDREDRGFVLVLLSLIMSTMFLMAGFAVDLGYWYLRSSQIQRAADSAALAGSIDMPNAGLAASNAIKSATKNGFTNGVNGVSVNVTPNAGGRVDVSITDNNVPAFFTSLILPHVTIGRKSSAEQLSPVPMGAPYNVLGTGTLSLSDDIPRQNYWLAINGYCTPKEDGDLYTAGFDGNRRYKNPRPNKKPVPLNTDCSTASDVNADYQSGGYDYSIVMPPNTPGKASVKIYDPGFNPYCGQPDWTASFPGDVGFPTAPDYDDCPPSLTPPDFTTVYTLYDTNNTPSPADDTLIAQKSWGWVTSSSLIDNWVSLGQLPKNTTAQPHKYRLNVNTPPTQNSLGVNAFAIKAQRSWDSSDCDARTVPTCPQVSGDGAMSVNTTSVGDSGWNTYYLANIENSYAGYSLSVSLWDAGEGFDELRLIAPDGRVVPVKWAVSPATAVASGGPTYAVDVSDDDCPEAPWHGDTLCPQPGNNRYSRSKYNDRMLTLTAKIPDDYQAYIDRAGGSTWWSMQYVVNDDAGSLHDRTTWLVSIGGQEPVHLVQTH